MSKRALLVLALLATPAVALADPKADVKADYELVCNVVERSGADKTQDPSQRAQKIALYLTQHLKTQEVKLFMASLAVKPPAEKGPALKKAAADAGYTGSCPFADMK
jgi:hypothetical protein